MFITTSLSESHADVFVSGADLQAYCSGLIDAGFSRIPSSNGPADKLPYRGSVQEHLRLLNISKAVIEELTNFPSIQEVAAPTLLHPDIHKRNIFVSDEDPSCVTGIIDWQSTCIEPTFVYADETPDMVEDPAADIAILEKKLSTSTDGTSKVATSEETISESPEEAAARKRHEKDVWTCIQTFEVALKGYAPKMNKARVMDQTLLRPFRYCGSSWRDSAAALQQELIELSQRWTELGLPGSCPYQPTTEELTEHVKQYEDFESVQQLKMILKSTLGIESDGWVPADAWESVKRQHKAFHAEWMETIKESGSDPDRARKLWPFDDV